MDNSLSDLTEEEQKADQSVSGWIGLVETNHGSGLTKEILQVYHGIDYAGS